MEPGSQESDPDPWDDHPEDRSAAADDTWLRPVWADDASDLDTLPWHRPSGSPPLPRRAAATATSEALLAPLAHAAADVCYRGGGGCRSSEYVHCLLSAR